MHLKEELHGQAFLSSLPTMMGKSDFILFLPALLCGSCQIRYRHAGGIAVNKEVHVFCSKPCNRPQYEFEIENAYTYDSNKSCTQVFFKT